MPACEFSYSFSEIFAQPILSKEKNNNKVHGYLLFSPLTVYLPLEKVSFYN
jgi:hypothetical protein